MLKTRTPNVLMFALLIGKSMLGEDFFFLYIFFFRLLKVNYVDKRKDKKLLVSVHLLKILTSFADDMFHNLNARGVDYTLLLNKYGEKDYMYIGMGNPPKNIDFNMVVNSTDISFQKFLIAIFFH